MRNVIVTGGSRGLGLEVARRLAAEDYRAIVIARKMNAELASRHRADRTIPPRLTLFSSPFDLGNIEANTRIGQKSI